MSNLFRLIVPADSAHYESAACQHEVLGTLLDPFRLVGPSQLPIQSSQHW